MTCTEGLIFFFAFGRVYFALKTAYLVFVMVYKYTLQCTAVHCSGKQWHTKRGLQLYDDSALLNAHACTSGSTNTLSQIPNTSALKYPFHHPNYKTSPQIPITSSQISNLPSQIDHHINHWFTQHCSTLTLPSCCKSDSTSISTNTSNWRFRKQMTSQIHNTLSQISNLPSQEQHQFREQVWHRNLYISCRIDTWETDGKGSSPEHNFSIFCKILTIFARSLKMLLSLQRLMQLLLLLLQHYHNYLFLLSLYKI